MPEDEPNTGKKMSNLIKDTEYLLLGLSIILMILSIFMIIVNLPILLVTYFNVSVGVLWKIVDFFFGSGFSVKIALMQGSVIYKITTGLILIVGVSLFAFSYWLYKRSRKPKTLNTEAPKLF